METSRVGSDWRVLSQPTGSIADYVTSGRTVKTIEGHFAIKLWWSFSLSSFRENRRKNIVLRWGKRWPMTIGGLSANVDVNIETEWLVGDAMCSIPRSHQLSTSSMVNRGLGSGRSDSKIRWSVRLDNNFLWALNSPRTCSVLSTQMHSSGRIKTHLSR